MKVITDVFNAILKPGAAVFLPLIIMFFVIVLKLISKKSITWLTGFKSALLLGIAFIAMGIIIGFMMNMFAAPFRGIQKLLSLNTIDLGWTPMSALSWAWPFAFALFPIQIFTNIIMLKLRWTKTLNADLWNVWNKIFTALLVSWFIGPIVGTAGGVVFGLLMGWVQVIFELKNGDVIYEKQYKATKIQNINSPHSMFLTSPLIYFIDKFLLKFRFFQDKNEVKKVKNVNSTLVRVMRENMFVGFFLGIVISLVTLWTDLDNWDIYVKLPFQVAAALVLFPMVAKLFSQSLTPFGQAVQKIMTEKFKNREIYIGLDWPFLAGNPKLWLVATMLIPFTLTYAIIFSFVPGVNMVFPLGGLLNVCLVPPLLIICEQNVKRMFLIGVILTPIYLFFAGFAAPVMTNAALGNQSALVGVDKDIIGKLGSEIYISNAIFETPDFRFGLSAGSLFLVGNITTQSVFGFLAFILWVILFCTYYHKMKKESILLKKERLGEEYDPSNEPIPVGYELFQKIKKKLINRS